VITMINNKPRTLIIIIIIIIIIISLFIDRFPTHNIALLKAGHTFCISEQTLKSIQVTEFTYNIQAPVKSHIH